MKKLNLLLTSVFVFVFVFFSAKFAFAYSVTPNPAYNDVPYVLSDDIVSPYIACLYSPDGSNNNSYFGCIVATDGYKLDRLATLHTTGVYHFVIYNTSADFYDAYILARSGTYTDALASPAFVDQIAYNFTSTATPTGGTGGTGGSSDAGIHFFNSSALTGDASVTNQLGASVATTTGSLLPVLAVVGGIIFAFLGIEYIISLVKKTGSKKETK